MGLINTETKQFSSDNLVRGIKIIFRQANEYKELFIGVVTLALIYAAIDPLDTYFFGRFIDALTHNKVTTIHGYTIPIYILLVITWLIFQTIEITIHKHRTLYSLKLSELVRTSYITKVFNHIVRLPLSFHKTMKHGEVQERTRTAAFAIQNLISDDLTSTLPNVIGILIGLGFIAHLDIRLVCFVLLSLCIFIYVTYRTARPLAAIQRESQKVYARTTGISADAMTNIRIVKDFTAEKYQTDLIDRRYKEQAIPIWFKLMGLRREQTFLQQTIILSTRFIVFLASIYFVQKQSWTIGDLVIANGYLTLLFSPIRDISNNWRNIQNGIIAIEDTQEILDMPTEVYEPENSYTLSTIQGSVSFNAVDFGYDAGPGILRNISFSVKPGEIVALVGESGVGKSSLIDLISAYHFATKGIVSIDGVDIKKIPLSMLRKNIGIVTQEVTLFNDTVSNNLKYGNFEKTLEDVKEAARKAHCADFIEKFPAGWDQEVGERGIKLSVGQKQRIAIARAILKNPRILILDEPTSALDAGSEKIITEALDELMKGKTTFVVAHRLSTVRRATMILVFKGGKIVESGTHEELIRKEGGEYRRLYELQIGLHS